MATLTQNPCPTKFVGDMQDLILTSADSVEFQLKQGNTLILKETYSPANGSIRIVGLEKVIDACLYGELKESGVQGHLSSSFDFLVDGTTILTKTLYASHQHNSLDSEGARQILTHGNVDVCHPGIPHPLTFLSSGIAKLYSASGQELGSVSVGSNGGIYTQDCDPEQLFPVNFHQGHHITYTCGSDSVVSHIDHGSYPDGTPFLFLNMYDAPEVLLVKKSLEVKPQSTDDIGTSYGEDRKFHVEQNDEYTAESGIIASRSHYSQWRDLVMSRKVSVLWDGIWLPVIITKPNYNHTLRSSALFSVAFTFRMARQRDNGMIMK